jgi:hypothetical protein
MQWTVGNIEQECFVRVVLEGDFSTDEFFLIFKEILSRADWRQGMHILFDDTNLSFTDTNLDMIRHASDCYAEYHFKIGDGRIALLMNSVADFARGRQFELLTGNKIPSNIGIFRNEADAVDWLLTKEDSFDSSSDQDRDFHIFG